MTNVSRSKKIKTETQRFQRWKRFNRGFGPHFPQTIVVLQAQITWIADFRLKCIRIHDTVLWRQAVVFGKRLTSTNYWSDFRIAVADRPSKSRSRWRRSPVCRWYGWIWKRLGSSSSARPSGRWAGCGVKQQGWGPKSTKQELRSTGKSPSTS